MSARELECLQRLARSGRTGLLPCPVWMLEHLRSCGLVERVVSGWMPLENPQCVYVISASGLSRLRRSRGNGNAL